MELGGFTVGEKKGGAPFRLRSPEFGLVCFCGIFFISLSFFGGHLGGFGHSAMNLGVLWNKEMESLPRSSRPDSLMAGEIYCLAWFLW
jgi:hypothetical protein